MATSKKGFCLFCMTECGIQATVEDNKLIKVVGDPDDVVSQGYICEKGPKMVSWNNHKDRITSPLKRVNGKHIPISWETALDEISGKLKHIRDQGRGDRIFYIAPMHMGYNPTTLHSYEKWHRLGSRWMANQLSVEKAYMVKAEGEMYGGKLSPELASSDTIFSLGHNIWLTTTMPHTRKILNDISKDPNKNLIVVDPVKTKSAELADHHVQLNAGTDLQFLSLLAREILITNTIDLTKRAVNYENVLKVLMNINVDEYLEVCGVPYEQVKTVARILSNSKSASYHSGNGACHSQNTRGVYYLIALLPLLLDHINKPGCMKLNAVGMSISTPVFNQQKTPFTNKDQLWGIMGGGDVVENLYINDSDKMDALIIDYNNPVERFPNTDKLKEQLTKMNLIVALDSFHTASTKHEDYILPVPTFSERYEAVHTFHDQYGWTQISKPIVDATYTKTCYDIYSELISRLGLDVTIDDASYYNDRVKFISEQINNFLQGCDKALDILTKTAGKDWPAPVYTSVWLAFISKYLDNNKEKSFKDAIKFADERLVEIVDQGKTYYAPGYVSPLNKFDCNDKLYRHVLKANHSLSTLKPDEFFLMSGYREPGVFNLVLPRHQRGEARINPTNAEQYNLNTGDIIKISSQHGQLTLPCYITDKTPVDIIMVPNGVTINTLTTTKTVDHLNPQYKSTRVTIIKV